MVRTHRSHPALPVTIPALLIAVALTSCGKKDAPAANGEAPAAHKSGAKDTGGGKAKAKTHQVPVETAVVRRGTFAQRLRLSGQFAPNRVVKVAVEMPGRVIDLKAEEGKRVEAGAIVLRQDTTLMRAQLAQADAAVAQAEAGVAMARNQLNRSEKLARSKVLDQARLDAARLAYKQAKAGKGVAAAARKLVKANLGKLLIRAPMSGTVLRRGVELGEVANPGPPLLTIADFATVKLLIDVPERDVARLKLGQEVPLSVPALGDRALVGKIARIPMQADARNRTYPVELAVNNADGALRGGMTAEVNLLLDQRERQVVIPLDAVVDEPTPTLSKITSVVFVVEGGVARRRVVQTGPMQGETVLITAGLKGGEQLIVVGQRRVVDGDAVRVSSEKPAKTASAGDRS